MHMEKCTWRGLNPRPQRHKLRALTDCATRAPLINAKTPLYYFIIQILFFIDKVQ